VGRERREFVAWMDACDGGRSVDNLVLEYLREFRGTIDGMRHDLSSLKIRVSSLEIRTATSQLEIAHAHERHNQVDDRMNRLERRLGLRDSND